jgi:CubicO group peptidase (beta-lactamase class C family)
MEQSSQEASMRHTNGGRSDERTAGGFSRRGLLLGAAAAAGAAGLPLLAVGRAQAGETELLSALGGRFRQESGLVSGAWHTAFKPVRDEFVRNFTERGEVGASVCVTLAGIPVVDLWGGIADPATSAPWQKDTLVHVWSCAKGVTALCAHILASRGQLDLDAPVVQYWPEFGQHGKQSITVEMLMSHKAGVPAIRQPLPPGALYDWDFMVETLAAEAPFWEPGTRHGYHALTFGFLVGELVRRISGKPLGDFVRDEITGPLRLDLWMGLPASEDHRVAPSIPADPPTAPPFPNWLLQALSDPTSVPALVFFNNGGYLNPGEADSRAAREAVIGATGAITNARGLARLYAEIVRPRLPWRPALVSDASLVRMARTISAGNDVFGSIPSRFACGYIKSMDNRRGTPANQDSGILSEDAFGHSGFGGSLGFCDPRASLSFGYTMNRQGPGTLLNPRGQSLVNAAYKSIGYVEAGGSFVRG